MRYILSTIIALGILLVPYPLHFDSLVVEAQEEIPFPIAGIDGYIFLAKHKEHLTPNIVIKPYSSMEALKFRAVEIGLGEDTVGFTIQPHDDNGNVCEIHLVDPAVRYTPEVAGHELFHCIYGQWHLYNW